MNSLLRNIFLLVGSALACAEEKPANPDATFERLSTAVKEGSARLKANPTSDEIAREYAKQLSEFAGYLTRRGQSGDADKALALFSSSLGLREQLCKKIPLELPLMRDLSVALNELGELLARRGQPGDADAALGHFRRSLEYSEAVYKALPESAAAGRDVAVSLDKLGSFLARRGAEGDPEKALAHFTRCLEISTKFFKVKPDSADSKRDVALSLERLGSFLSASHDADDRKKALEHLKGSLELREELYRAEPQSSDAGRELSITMEKVADLLARFGDKADAEKTLTLFTRSLEIREGLMRQFPFSGQTARDLSVGLNKLGDFLLVLGRPGDDVLALKHFTRDLEISEKLLKANPGSQQAARDVVISRYKLAGYAQKRGDATAEEAHGRAIVTVLKDRVANGMKFDAPIMALFEALKEKIGVK